jgi:hypothetical protein
MTRTLTALVLAAALVAGCTTISKVEGEQAVGERMTVQVTEAWNKVEFPGSKQPFEIWTQEGVFLDQLRFWPGIKPGQALVVLPSSATPAGQKAPRVPTYATGMSPDQLVALFEILYSNDGSAVTVTRVEPAVFAGATGVRFQFTIARKSDDLQLGGAGWVVVRGGELYAATFTAPNLAFWPKLLPKAEAVVKTAQIRG